MRGLSVRNQGLNEFGKEALRLVKELADDESNLKQARKNAHDFECDKNIAKAVDEAEYLEDCMRRKMQLIEMIIHC
jgi:hypothetical protein